MAIDDLLAAITDETDRRIAEAKEAHRAQLSSMREDSERRLLKKRQDLSDQCADKEKQMRAKADVHIALNRRNAILQKKQSLLESFYDDVVAQMAEEKPAALESFLKKCLDGIEGKGEIRPAKKHEALIKKLADGKQFTIGRAIDAAGGFTFVSDDQEYDFTFEHIVRLQVRPHTEVEVASVLFA